MSLNTNVSRDDFTKSFSELNSEMAKLNDSAKRLNQPDIRHEINAELKNAVDALESIFDKNPAILTQPKVRSSLLDLRNRIVDFTDLNDVKAIQECWKKCTEAPALAAILKADLDDDNLEKMIKQSMQHDDFETAIALCGRITNAQKRAQVKHFDIQQAIFPKAMKERDYKFALRVCKLLEGPDIKSKTFYLIDILSAILRNKNDIKINGKNADIQAVAALCAEIIEAIPQGDAHHNEIRQRNVSTILAQLPALPELLPIVKFAADSDKIAFLKKLVLTNTDAKISKVIIDLVGALPAAYDEARTSILEPIFARAQKEENFSLAYEALAVLKEEHALQASIENLLNSIKQTKTDNEKLISENNEILINVLKLLPPGERLNHYVELIDSPRISQIFELIKNDAIQIRTHNAEDAPITDSNGYQTTLGEYYKDIIFPKLINTAIALKDFDGALYLSCQTANYNQSLSDLTKLLLEVPNEQNNREKLKKVARELAEPALLERLNHDDITAGRYEEAINNVALLMKEHSFGALDNMMSENINRIEKIAKEVSLKEGVETYNKYITDLCQLHIRIIGETDLSNFPKFSESFARLALNAGDFNSAFWAFQCSKTTQSQKLLGPILLDAFGQLSAEKQITNSSVFFKILEQSSPDDSQLERILDKQLQAKDSEYNIIEECIKKLSAQKQSIYWEKFANQKDNLFAQWIDKLSFGESYWTGELESIAYTSFLRKGDLRRARRICRANPVGFKGVKEISQRLFEKFLKGGGGALQTAHDSLFDPGYDDKNMESLIADPIYKAFEDKIFEDLALQALAKGQLEAAFEHAYPHSNSTDLYQKLIAKVDDPEKFYEMLLKSKRIGNKQAIMLALLPKLITAEARNKAQDVANRLRASSDYAKALMMLFQAGFNVEIEAKAVLDKGNIEMSNQIWTGRVEKSLKENNINQALRYIYEIQPSNDAERLILRNLLLEIVKAPPFEWIEDLLSQLDPQGDLYSKLQNYSGDVQRVLLQKERDHINSALEKGEHQIAFFMITSAKHFNKKERHQFLVKTFEETLKNRENIKDGWKDEGKLNLNEASKLCYEIAIKIRDSKLLASCLNQLKNKMLNDNQPDFDLLCNLFSGDREDYLNLARNKSNIPEHIFRYIVEHFRWNPDTLKELFDLAIAKNFAYTAMKIAENNRNDAMIVPALDKFLALPAKASDAPVGGYTQIELRMGQALKLMRSIKDRKSQFEQIRKFAIQNKEPLTEDTLLKLCETIHIYFAPIIDHSDERETQNDLNALFNALGFENAVSLLRYFNRYQYYNKDFRLWQDFLIKKTIKENDVSLALDLITKVYRPLVNEYMPQLQKEKNYFFILMIMEYTYAIDKVNQLRQMAQSILNAKELEEIDKIDKDSDKYSAILKALVHQWMYDKNDMLPEIIQATHLWYSSSNDEGSGFLNLLEETLRAGNEDAALQLIKVCVQLPYLKEAIFKNEAFLKSDFRAEIELLIKKESL